MVVRDMVVRDMVVRDMVVRWVVMMDVATHNHLQEYVHF